MRLRIQSPGPTARNGQVWIDDVDRSADVCSVVITRHTDEPRLIDGLEGS
jgi:hypothetical protein